MSEINNYIEKSEAAILKAEEEVAAGKSGEQWIKIAGIWKDLAATRRASEIPPLAVPKLSNPRSDFRFGQYL